MNRQRLLCPVVLGVMIGALAASTTAQPETTTMPLEVQLQIDTTDLLVQQNPACRITYKNNGKAPLKYLHPSEHENSPMWRIVELRTGAETFQIGHPRELGDQPTPLPPGQTVEFDFQLRSRVEFSVPGDYEISAVVAYDLGKERAESNKLKVHITAVASRALTIVPVSGATSSVWYAFSVNAMADPTQLCRHVLGLSHQSGVTDAATVTKAPFAATPVASAPRNMSIATSQWVAWIEDGDLRFTHFNPDAGGAAPTGKWALPGQEARIIAPLYTDPDEDATKPPPGAALIWLGDAAKRTAYLQIVDFAGPGKATAGARTPLPTYPFLDAQSHARSDGRRSVTYVTQTEGGIALYTTPWPNQAIASNPLKKVAEWKAEFLAGAALVDAEDKVRGATLMVGDPATSRKPVLVRWTLDAKDGFTQEPPDPVEWRYAVEIHRAVVRIGPDGMPAALLSDLSGAWFFYDGYESVTPVPAVLAASKLPVDIIFADRGKPLLVGGSPGQGLKVVFPDGKTLPHKCG